MAIPDFSGKAGIALMRYDTVLAEWFFVGWADRGSVFIETTNNPSYYNLWAVIGAGATATSIQIEGYARVAILNAKK